jgi:ABC-type branched-subunit amino acid transport system permease subunit
LRWASDLSPYLFWLKEGPVRMIIYSLLLVVLMLTRPQGLFTLRKGVKVGGG